jgi:hypothetical protein
MTYVEYMRRLGVSVEPEVKAKAKAVPFVEPLSDPFRYQATIDEYVAGIPRRLTRSLLGSQRSLCDLFATPTTVDIHEYYRRALAAVDAELASRVGT